MVGQPILQAQGLTLTFGAKKAIDEIDVELVRGQIVGVVGRNGAGKSSLVSVLSGAKRPDAGTMTLDGEVYNPASVEEARAAGVGYVPQSIGIPEHLSAAQAIFRTSFRSTLPLAEQIERGGEILSDFGVDIAPEQRVGGLYPAEQASIELLRMACEETHVILLDEVSAAFDDHEISLFHALAKRLADEGRSLLFISHRLDEIQALSDRIIVMRDGHLHRSLIPRETKESQVIEEVFGSTFEIQKRPEPAPERGTLMMLEDVSAGRAVRDVTVALRAGEVLGITGLRRSGMNEVAEVIAGVRPHSGGTITMDGTPVRLSGELDALARGIAYVPEADTERDVDDAGPIKQALLPARDDDDADGAGEVPKSFAQEATELRNVIRAVQRFGIQAKSIEQSVGTLSGGDRNKVAVARTLAKRAKVFVLNQPSRGIDVKARQDLYGLIAQLCEQGCAVVLVSSDLSELIGQCQHVAVMRSGSLVDVYRNAALTEDNIMMLALGYNWFDDNDAVADAGGSDAGGSRDSGFDEEWEDRPVTRRAARSGSGGDTDVAVVLA